MALLHQAELSPSKTELIQGWAPTQPWCDAGTDATVTSVASYRFDDPDGEVGIETLLVTVGDGPVLQVPLTYRNAPLHGAEAWLIGTMQHSVLGKRWVYDAIGDPVYLAAVATAALTGGSQAELYLEVDGSRVVREPTALVTGSGMPGTPVPALGATSIRQESGATVVEAGGLRLVVERRIGTRAPLDADRPQAVLTGTWTDHPEPHTLVEVWTR